LQGSTKDDGGCILLEEWHLASNSVGAILGVGKTCFNAQVVVVGN